MPPPYQPVGRCIYCGATKYSIDRAKLSEEHIVPFCVDGAHILPEASCKKCAGKTGGDEQKLFGKSGPFRPLRVEAGSRSRGKDGALTIPYYPNGPGRGRFDVPPEADLPYVNARLVFGAPTAPETGDPIGMARDLSLLLSGRYDNWHGPHVYSPVIEMAVLMRFLAKIGHGFAVAELGSGFAPLLADFITKKDERVPWGLIGSIEQWGGAEPRYHLKHHAVSGRHGEVYAAVDIQLFSHMEFPGYRVLVGTMDG